MSVAWFWGLLLVGATAFLSVARTLMVRRLIPVEVLERHNEVAGFHLCRHRRRLCPAAWLRRDYGVGATAQIIMSSGLAFTIALVMVAIIALEQPFAGISRVGSQPFEQLEAMFKHLEISGSP